MVLGSDGLWDNLFGVKVISLIKPFVRSSDKLLDPALVAEIVAQEAERYSHMQNYFSPFAKHAKDHFYDYTGGKVDDITVIVA